MRKIIENETFQNCAKQLLYVSSCPPPRYARHQLLDLLSRGVLVISVAMERVNYTLQERSGGCG